jgi:hypothetical protein
MSIDNNALREMVREALRDALATSGKLPAPVSPAAVTEPISLTSNSELFAFVQRILDMATDSATANRLRSGQIRFELSGTSHQSHETTPQSNQNGLRIERGAVTEAMVKKAAEAGGVLIAGPSAVVTPLAREKARKLGVTINKETSSTQRNR